MEPREGSRKRQVYDAYREGGEDSAFSIGAELELKTGTLKSWISHWAKGMPLEKVSDDKPKPVKVKKALTGKRVKATWNYLRTGTLIAEGPEVSGVKWDTHITKGPPVEYVPNKYLLEE